MSDLHPYLARAGRAAADPEHAVVVRAPVAPLVGEPRVSASQTSQLLAGHALAVEERAGDWLRVRAGDDYAGWVHAGYVTPAAAALGSAGAAWYRQASVVLDGRVAGPGGRRRLPLGAVLLPGETCDDDAAVPAAELAARFPARRAALVASALHLFEGTSYQWGGLTPWGADCSGLVQTVFALHGVPLPRDAWQQSEAGAPAGDEPLALEPADLLFFSDREDGRITHVAIAAGAARLVHLALGRGGFAVERLEREGDPYVARLRAQVRVARRLPLPG